MKYFIYKGTGGLFHNLRGLSKAIDLSIQNNVTLIIDMKCHVAFGGQFDKYFTIKCDQLSYRCDYVNVDLPLEVKKKSAQHFGYNGKNKNFEIKAEDDVQIFYGFYPISLFSHIKVKKDYFRDLQLNNALVGKKYIAVHFRNSDKKNDKTLFLDTLEEAFNKFQKNKILYVASDDYDFYQDVRKKFPKMKILRKTFFEPHLKNLQYGSSDKEKQMYDCLVDVYYILHADIFVPSLNSQMSQCIVEMIKNRNTIFPSLRSKTKIVRPKKISNMDHNTP